MDLDETLIHSCHVRESPQIILEIGTKQVIIKLLFLLLNSRLDLMCDLIVKNFSRK